MEGKEMKPLSWLFWVAVAGIIFCLVLQFYAMPLIDSVQSRFSISERQEIGKMRTEMANRYCGVQ
jgi:hypothetical protein